MAQISAAIRAGPAVRAWIAVMLPLVVGAILLALNWSTQVPFSTLGYQAPYGFLALVFIGTVFVSVGAFIISRYSQNPIGWTFCGIGLLSATELISSQYATYGLLTEPGRLPGANYAAWLYQSSGVIVASGSSTFVLLIFPDGRLPSRAWRPALGLAVLAVATVTTGIAFRPGSLPMASHVENPFGVAGAEESLLSVMALGAGLVTAAVVLSILSLLARYRRAGRVQREQIKWIAYAAALHSAAVAVYVSFLASFGFATEALGLLASLVPIATGIAILRYRLYDIDVLIRRTLIYATVSALLAAVYVGGVALVQFVLSPFTTGSPIAVAVSTLAVVALFQPLRRRIGSAVDRRFYRVRYDAERTLDAFAVRLRDEVDLEAVRGDLLDAVYETIRPAHASVWLRR